MATSEKRPAETHHHESPRVSHNEADSMNFFGVHEMRVLLVFGIDTEDDIEDQRASHAVRYFRAGMEDKEIKHPTDVDDSDNSPGHTRCSAVTFCSP